MPPRLPDISSILPSVTAPSYKWSPEAKENVRRINRQKERERRAAAERRVILEQERALLQARISGRGLELLFCPRCGARISIATCWVCRFVAWTAPRMVQDLTDEELRRDIELKQANGISTDVELVELEKRKETAT